MVPVETQDDVMNHDTGSKQSIPDIARIDWQ
ncbi:Protein of unknown function [Leuconostoc citreum]|nr:Protein of unknown function [Leuconostoc citreum]